MKRFSIILLIFTAQFNFAQNTTFDNVSIGISSPAFGVKIKTNFPGSYGGWARGFSVTSEIDNNYIGLGSFGGLTNGTTSLIYSYIGKDWNDTYIAFLPNGNVGVGTTNPTEKLDVNGATKVKESLFISGASGGYTTGDNPVLYFGVNSDFAKISTPFGDKMVLSSYHGYTFNTSYNGATPLPALTIGITGNVGIGTTNPTDKLHVEGGGVASSVSNNEGGYLSLLNQSKTGDQFNTWRIYNMTGGYGNSLQFWGYSPSGSNSGSKMTLLDNGNVGIGTTNPTSKLTVAGNINSREVKVTVDAGADFVFENNYNLPSLESVDKFIKENKHLPEIASAKEMQKDGINLSEMNIKLLQKIEELTLYVIEMKKENVKQNIEIKNLRDKLSSK